MVEIVKVRDQRVNMLFSTPERKLLEKLSKASGMTMTDVVIHSLKLYQMMRYEKGKTVTIKKGKSTREFVVL